MSQNQPLTESRNPYTMEIDRATVEQQVLHFIREEESVVAAIAATSLSIARAVDLIVAGLKDGGRLIYAGAGTSGRLGVLDASECPPTFGVESGLVLGLIAGGETALLHAVEGAEDDVAAGGKDLDKITCSPKDVVVGITASGTTPYVRGALARAREIGAKTILVACNPANSSFAAADVLINPITGPEVITGSTRLKAGTATKLVLNMLSSISMIRMGKVYENLMVNVQVTNAKLRRRAIRIVAIGGRIEENTAEEYLKQADGDAKLAIYLARRRGTLEEAKAALKAADGFLYRALEESEGVTP